MTIRELILEHGRRIDYDNRWLTGIGGIFRVYKFVRGKKPITIYQGEEEEKAAKILMDGFC